MPVDLRLYEENFDVLVSCKSLFILLIKTQTIG